MLDRLRWRLTMGYAGVFVLILILLGAAAVFGFSRELTDQQDTLLTQEAEDVTRNLQDGEHREVLAEGSAEYSWVALDTRGRVTDRDPTAATLGTLGLPSKGLAQEALASDEAVSATIRGPEGNARVVSMPMRGASDEIVGIVQYARSLEGVQKTVGRLVLVLLPLALGGLGAALVGGLFMAGRAMRPARESFERQRAFIADASHELKTPLTLIRADAEMVLYRERLNRDDRTLVEHALAETDRMGSILSDLLLVARLDAGKLEVAEKPFDLAPVLSEEAERFGARAAAKGVRLEVGVPGELPARGDLKKDGTDTRGPAGQRRQVRAARRAHRRLRPPGRRPDGGDRGGHGARHPPGASGPRLRPFLPGGGLPRPRQGLRHGSRAGHSSGPRAGPGRRPRGRRRKGGGEVPPPLAPGVRRRFLEVLWVL